MNIFTSAYLKSTCPKTKWTELYTNWKIWFAIVFHTFLYLAFINLVKYTFTNSIFNLNQNLKMAILLFVIMIVGYTARYLRVQDIYQGYHKDMTKTRNHCDKAFITWFYLA